MNNKDKKSPKFQEETAQQSNWHTHCNFNSELRNKDSSNWYLMVEILLTVY